MCAYTSTQPVAAIKSSLTTPHPRSSSSPLPRFTERWGKKLRHPSVPVDALTPALQRKFTAANETKERHRRASEGALRRPSLLVHEDATPARRGSGAARITPELDSQNPAGDLTANQAFGPEH